MTAIDQTERAADRIRGELLVTLSELDRRRQRATDLGGLLRDHAALAIAAGAAVAAVSAVIVVVARIRARSRGTRQLRDRTRAFMRAWEHPGRIATRAKYRPLPAELGRKAALVVTSVIIQRLAHRAANRVLPA